MPARSRWLLATLFPLWLVCFGLHVTSTVQTGAAWAPFFASPVRGDSYPHVGGVRPERISEGLDIQLGDRLLRARDVDLEGVGYLDFYAWMTELADESLEIPLLVEREGRRLETVLRLSPTGIPWSRFALWGLGVGLAMLVLLRVPEDEMAQLLFAGFTSFAIVESPFTINYSLTLVYQGIFMLGGGLALMLLMRFFFLFPGDLDERHQIPLRLSWIAALLFYVPRIFYLVGGPMPTAAIPLITLASDASLGCIMLAAVTWNYVHSGEAGRRRLRGVLWATAVALSPLALAPLFDQLFPGLGIVRFGIDVAAFSALSIPVALAIAVVRHDAFDIDRLIGATATFGAALVILLGGLLAVAPVAARTLAEATGLDRDMGALAFAIAASLALIPLTRILRPRVEALLTPSRRALERGFQSLRRELTEHAESDTLLSFAAARIQALLHAEPMVLYSRGASGYEPVFVSDGFAAGPRDFADPEVVALDAQQTPLVRGDHELRPLERAALDAFAAEAIVPFQHRGGLDAFLTLGASTSGDGYTSSHRTLLALAADQVQSERIRRDDADRIAESGDRMRGLEAEREAAEAAYLARTRSLATASHDLRQPLHAMGLLVEAVATRELDEPTAALVGRLHTATRALEGMFDTLLDLSRLEAGEVEPERERVSLAALFARLAAAFEAEAAAKGLRLEVDAAPWAVLSDPVWLARVLQNLLANAIRYTEQGRVRLQAKAVGDEEVEIVVSDTGPGIPADQQAHVFEAFRRLDVGTRSDERGLGLGLAIVDRLTTLLGHELSLESAPGEGTSFRLRLARTADPAPEAGDADASSAALAGLAVVVVDDDVAIRDGMSAVLEGWGCRVLAVPSEDELLARIDEWADEGPPDLVVVDVRLAGERSGLDALAALRAHSGRELPALVITGESDAATLSRLRDDGHPVLTKPVAPARLRAFLQRIRRRATQD